MEMTFDALKEQAIALIIYNIEVEDDVKALLNADYALSMRMSVLPESDKEEFKETGLNWND